MTLTPDNSPLDWVRAELAALDEEDLRRAKRTVTPRPEGRCAIDGRELINFAGNDYLGLAGDPRLIAAAQEALTEDGTGSRASALVCGHTSWHARLEQRIAQFEGTAAALVFPTGYAANMGTIAALVGAGDVVCADRLSHASLIDGCRVSGASLRVYPHADADRLDHELSKHASARRRLIVTDGLFSMDGTLAPLGELCDVADRRRAMLLVDDAHGTGVLGRHGRGTVERLGVEERVSIRVGTLSKAVGSQGGFVAGSRSLINWLVNRARSQMYSTALNPAACAAALTAFDVMSAESERRTKLRELGRLLRKEMSVSGLPIDLAGEGPIVPVIVGEAANAVRLSGELERRGFLVPAIRPPTVSRETARLRISLSAAHRESDVTSLAAALADVWDVLA